MTGDFRGFIAHELAGIDGEANLYGVKEDWILPVAVIEALGGFGREVWLDAIPQSLLAVRLRGSSVACHWGKARNRTVRATGVTLQPKGSPNHFTADGPVRFAQLFLSDDLLGRAADALELRSSVTNDLRDDLVFLADQEFEKRTLDYLTASMAIDTSRLELEARALLVTEHLLRRYHHPSELQAKAPQGLAPWQLRRVCDMLASTLDRPVSLAQLAALVRLSPFHFSRAFKASTGLPPHRYQIMLRVHRAQDLLATTEKSIGDVAAAVGYDDSSYFARMFSREVGLSPTIYRRQRLL